MLQPGVIVLNNTGLVVQQGGGASPVIAPKRRPYAVQQYGEYGTGFARSESWPTESTHYLQAPLATFPMNPASGNYLNYHFKVASDGD